MKNKTIFRKPKNTANPYARIDKDFLNDERLSFRAKGIMAYLLSKPDNWELNTKELQKVSKEGRDAVRSAVKELVDLGYVRYEKTHVKGKFNHVYTVHEDPNADVAEPETEKPEPEKPETGNQGYKEECLHKQMNNTNKYNNKRNTQQTFNKSYKRGYGKNNGWNRQQREDKLPKAIQHAMNRTTVPKEEVDPEVVARLNARLARMRSRLSESQKNGTIQNNLYREGA